MSAFVENCRREMQQKIKEEHPEASFSETNTILAGLWRVGPWLASVVLFHVIHICCLFLCERVHGLEGGCPDCVVCKCRMSAKLGSKSISRKLFPRKRSTRRRSASTEPSRREQCMDHLKLPDQLGIGECGNWQKASAKRVKQHASRLRCRFC